MCFIDSSPTPFTKPVWPIRFSARPGCQPCVSLIHPRTSLTDSWEGIGRLSISWIAAVLEILMIGPVDSNQEVPESLQDVSRPIWGPEFWGKTEVGTNVWICSPLCRPRQISGKDIFTMKAERKELGWVWKSTYLRLKCTFLIGRAVCHSGKEPEQLLMHQFELFLTETLLCV